MRPTEELGTQPSAPAVQQNEERARIEKMIWENYAQYGMQYPKRTGTYVVAPSYEEVKAVVPPEATVTGVGMSPSRVSVAYEMPPVVAPPFEGFRHPGGLTYADVGVYLGRAKSKSELEARAQQVKVAEREAVIEAAISGVTFFVLPPLASKVVSWLPEAITEPVEKGLYATKLKILERIPIWKVYEPFKVAIAPGEMAIPYFERFGIGELEAETVAWGAMETPRMGGVMILREFGPSIVKQGVAFSPTVLGGFYVKGAIPREATFTPLVSQTQLTRMGIQPYVPARVVAPTISEASLTGLFAGVSSVMVPRIVLPRRLRPPDRTLLPVTWQPEIQRIRLFQENIAEKTNKQALALIAPQMQETIVTPKQAIVQIPKPVQKAISAFAPSIPRSPLVLPKSAFPFNWLPGGGESAGKGGKSLFGKWFRKTQPIKTPKQMLQTFFGYKPRRRKQR